jgi:hypothetical protein
MIIQSRPVKAFGMAYLDSSQITILITRPMPIDLLLINRRMKVIAAFYEPGAVNARIGVSVPCHGMSANMSNLIQ